MKLETRYKIHMLWKNKWWFILWSVLGLSIIAFEVNILLHSYYYVETLEYANVDFEWVDDFRNYEVVIRYDDKPHYLTIKDSKVKFIYTDDDFLNFVVVKHKKRIMDKKDDYYISAFYINLNYKEIELDEIH